MSRVKNPLISAPYSQGHFSVAAQSDAKADTGVPLLNDKWVLSSALQKLIRRGKINQAAKIALRLHAIDPHYLRRRLPVVALEDIAIGSIENCRAVLTACASSEGWRTDANGTIASLVSQLTGPAKCRAACDALCLAEAHAETPGMMEHLLASAPAYLVDLASDRTKPRLKRLNALRVVGGITLRQGGRYVTLSKFDAAAMAQIGANLGLSADVCWLMTRSRVTSGIAATLPIVIEVTLETIVRDDDDFPYSLEFIGGVPLCALDMHCELGRRALREFFLSSEVFGEFAARCIHAKSPLGAFYTAMFHAESAVLDRCVWSPGLEELTEETRREEMRQQGLRYPSDRHELYELIRADAERLAQIRTRHLHAAACARLE